MKNLIIKFVVAFAIITFGVVAISAQSNSNGTINPDSDAAEGLDLYAVAELFKDSETLEKFEQALNNPANSINNLDLNDDNEIDFINVSERVKDDTHLIVLQVPLGANDFQDVAAIAVERESDNYNLHIQGDETIYGANYYVVPATNNFSAWNVVRWIFQPNYRVYVSPYGFRHYPTYWTARRPVALNVYRTRANLFVGRRNFVASRTVTVHSVHKIKYTPRSTALVTRRTKAVRTAPTVNSPNKTATKTVTEIKTRTVKRGKH